MPCEFLEWKVLYKLFKAAIVLSHAENNVGSFNKNNEYDRQWMQSSIY